MGTHKVTGFLSEFICLMLAFFCFTRLVEILNNLLNPHNYYIGVTLVILLSAVISFFIFSLFIFLVRLVSKDKLEGMEE